MTESIFDVVLLLGGFQVVLTGLIAFAGKIWIDRLNESYKGQISTEHEKLKAELEATNLKLQAALDRDLHVHRLQFEKEQKVYESIWSALVEVQKRVGQLRPILDYVDPDEPEEERKRRRLAEVIDAFNPFLDEANKERPFYSEEVFTELHELRVLMQNEMTEYEYLDSNKAEYWEKAKQNTMAISDKIDLVCESIRNRLKSISAT